MSIKKKLSLSLLFLKVNKKISEIKVSFPNFETLVYCAQLSGSFFKVFIIKIFFFH